MQERQGILNGIDLATEDTLQELVGRTLKNGSIEDTADDSFDIRVEIVDGGIDGSSGDINPSKDTVIDLRLEGVDLCVDFIGVRSGLVVHILVDAVGDGIGKVGSCCCCPLIIFVDEWTEGKQLNLNAEKTNDTDKKAGQSGSVEDVVQEPIGMNMLSGRKAELGRNLVQNSCDERMLRVCL